MKHISSIILFLFFSGFAHAQGTSGLVAHWDMNGSTNDVSGNGHDGHQHLIVADTGIDGVYGHAYYFNGINSYITTAASAAYNISNYSICATVKVKGFNTGTCQANMIFLRGIAGAGTGSYALEFKDKPTTGYDCYTYDTTLETFWTYTSGLSCPSISSYYYAPPIVKGKWYRIVATFNDTSYKIYINDTLKVTANILTPGVPMSSSGDSASIGYDFHDASAGYPYPFKGVIDDIMVYNRVLNDSEIIHYGDTCGTITVEPVPTSSHIGGNAVYTISTSIVGALYQWQRDTGSGFVNLANSGPFSGVFTSILNVTGITAGLVGNHYRCIVSNSWGCFDTSSQVLLTTGISEAHTMPLVTIYPNPVNDELSIEYSYSLKNVYLKVFNGLGLLVENCKISEPKSTLKINNLPAGVYIIEFITDQGTIYNKFIKG